MKKNTKSLMEALVILIMLVVLVSSLSYTNEPETGQIQDFYGNSREVTLNELVDVADEKNKLLYLPFELPNSLEITAIYLKDNPFITIIVYSAEGNKDYKTAEFTVEISSSESVPTYNELLNQTQDSTYETALEINNWPVLINERASTGGYTETRNKYGEYIIVIMAWIDGMRYIISCRTLMKTESISIVESMVLKN